MITDARTPATILEDDAALFYLACQGHPSRVGADTLYRLDALGLVTDHSRDALLTDAGRGYVAVLRITGDVPRTGVVTTTETATGHTLHYWPTGFGGRRILAARLRAATGLLDYAPMFAPPGHSGRSDAGHILEAHRQTTARAALLEADAAEEYRNPWE